MASEVSKVDSMSSEDTTAVPEESQLLKISVTATIGEDFSHLNTEASLSRTYLNPVVEAASVPFPEEHSKAITSECYLQTAATKAPGDLGELTTVPIVKIDSQISSELNIAGVDEDTGETSDDLSTSPSTIPVEDTVTAQGSSEPTIQNVNAGEPEHPAVSSVEQSPDQRLCCPEYRGPVGYIRISMMYLRESKYLLPFQFLLLALPISSIYMGATYVEKCPILHPMLLFMMGLLGTLIILTRMCVTFRKALFPFDEMPKEAKVVIMSAILVLILLFCTEMAFFWTSTPSFSHGTENYCHRTFYYFLCYVNYGSLLLVVLLMILHCPGSRLFNRIGTPEVEVPPQRVPVTLSDLLTF